MGLLPSDIQDPYPDTIEYFTSIEEKMPLSSAPEPKRRFLPSKNEAKQVMKLVRAIREGRILPYKPPAEREREQEEEEEVHFDLWQNEEPQAPNPMHIPAPKLPPPGYDMSYNPPEEYLPYVHSTFVFTQARPLTRIIGRRKSGKSGRMLTQRSVRRSTFRKNTTLCGRCLHGVA
jgi:ribosome biogenesis protein ERB1